jgi:radical SAM protein with 4Fe4S-binding SPASM domain
MSYVSNGPIQVFLGLTYKCNLSCPHCYSKLKLKNKDLDLITIKSIIDQCEKYNVLKIILTYGENMLREDFFEILEYISKKGIHTTLITNGLIANEQIISKLKSSGLNKLLFSFDSASQEKHDAFRGKPGIYAKVISGVKLAKKYNLKCGLVVSLNNDNATEVDAIVELAKEWGVNDLNFLTTRDLRFINANNFSSGLLPDTIKQINTLNVKDLSINFHDPLAIEICDQKSNEEISQNVCGAGKFYLSIAPDGTFYPCNFISIKLGTVFDCDLMDAFDRSKKLFNIRKENVNCKECHFFTNCEGGCAAFSYLNNSFFERDCRCKHEIQNK